MSRFADPKVARRLLFATAAAVGAGISSPALANTYAALSNINCNESDGYCTAHEYVLRDGGSIVQAFARPITFGFPGYPNPSVSLPVYANGTAIAPGDWAKLVNSPIFSNKPLNPTSAQSSQFNQFLCATKVGLSKVQLRLKANTVIGSTWSKSFSIANRVRLCGG